MKTIYYINKWLTDIERKYLSVKRFCSPLYFSLINVYISDDSYFDLFGLQSLYNLVYAFLSSDS